MMKMWNAYASEHSMNLVMIGTFKEVRDAQEAKCIIDRLSQQASAESGAYEPDSEPHEQRFSDEMLQILTESHFHTVHPTELGQVELDVQVEVQVNQVVITTDEVDVSAFLKLLLDKGARVEVYSAHDYPDTENGVDDQAE